MTQEEIKAIIRQEIAEILQDREMRDDYHSSVGALASIGRLHSQESFRNALKAILEESFGVQVINITEYDDEVVLITLSNVSNFRRVDYRSGPYLLI